MFFILRNLKAVLRLICKTAFEFYYALLQDNLTGVKTRIIENYRIDLR